MPQRLGTPAPRRALFLALTLVAAGTLSSCSDLFGGSSGGGGAAFLVPRASLYATLDQAPLVQSGDFVVYLASEANSGAGGTDLNLDGDFADLVASVIFVPGGAETLLRVAAVEAFIAGDQIYVLVDEDEDNKDWDGDGAQNDVVLLHWSLTLPFLKFVGLPNLAVDDPVFVAQGGLYYIDAPAALTPPETTLNFLPPQSPTTPIRLNDSDGAFTLDPRFHFTDEGLVFLRQDETIEGRELNNDGDQIDTAILALHDSSDPAAPIRNVGLALPGPGSPVQAASRGVGDWLVAFSVSEANQGLNLNDLSLFDPAWNPPHCPAGGDLDLGDNILVFLNFLPWSLNPVADPPVNTGLVANLRIVAIPDVGGSPGFVGTLSLEGSLGDPCNLNGDGDFNDFVFRWTEAQEPILPFGVVDDMVAGALPLGGALGVAVLDGRFVIVASESADERDHDGDGLQTHDLVAWIDPLDGVTASYTYDHSAGSGFYVGTDWMAESEDGQRLLISRQEDVAGFSLNTGDQDLDDTVPTFAVFSDDDPDDLDFPGPPVAITEGTVTPDMAITDGRVLFRIEESADSVNWDMLGGTNSTVLLATPLDQLDQTKFVGILSPGTEPGVFSQGDGGAAYVVRENSVQKDLNFDGDQSDRIVMFFAL